MQTKITNYNDHCIKADHAAEFIKEFKILKEILLQV